MNYYFLLSCCNQIAECKLPEGCKTLKLFLHWDFTTEFNLKQSPAFTKAGSLIYIDTQRKGGGTSSHCEYSVLRTPSLIQFIAQTLHLKQKESDTTPMLPLAAVACLSYRTQKILCSDQAVHKTFGFRHFLPASVEGFLPLLAVWSILQPSQSLAPASNCTAKSLFCKKTLIESD